MYCLVIWGYISHVATLISFDFFSQDLLLICITTNAIKIICNTRSYEVNYLPVTTPIFWMEKNLLQITFVHDYVLQVFIVFLLIYSEPFSLFWITCIRKQSAYLTVFNIEKFVSMVMKLVNEFICKCSV